MRLAPFAPLALVALGWAVPVGAQVYSDGIVVQALPMGARNVSTNLHAEGARLYTGPRLAISDDGQTFRFVDDDAFTPNAAPDAGVYSIDVEGDVIWVGLGFNDETAEGAPQTAAGFAYSTDGGVTWSYRPPPLDSPTDDTVQYGVSLLDALPIIVPQQSPPFDIDYDAATGDVWTAGWASGIRRSTDDGASWQRIVLPPDTLSEIRPEVPYSFAYSPEGARPVLPNDESNNFLGFSVLVDEAGTVWAGTVAGVNRADLSDVDPASGDRRWRRFFFDRSERSLVGNWTISIEEQPLDGARNPVWMANWRALLPEEEFGVTVWVGDDSTGAPIFEPRLVGEKVYDFAFDATRPGRVYAAGDAGLFVSDDEGTTWRTIRTFRDASGEALPVGLDAIAYAVAVTTGPNAALWVGTDDGLLKSTDGGATWQIFRVNVAPGEGDGAPDTDSYAYPNPFAPSTDGAVRIRFDLDGDATVRVRLFDFASTLVRTLDTDGRAGANEARWDGRTDDGTRVANGVYFYAVEAGGARFTGKILVLE